MSTKKEFKKFFLVGLLAFFSDISTYYLFTVSGLELNASKAISFLIGTLIGYLLNTIYTFEAAQYSSNTLIKYLLVYLVSMLLNVTVNALSIKLFLIFEIYMNISKFLAVIVATIFSMIFNFICLKYYVYSK
tara:strand:+ start:866 stop:1261 length:396 start_codon:yes stop_codon:yes gene_type:complete